MALNRAVVGRTVAVDPITVSRDAVVAFARSLGLADTMYGDEERARAAGHPNVVAPPTYAVALSARSAHLILDDPELGLDYTRVVHGEQSLHVAEDIHAGDALVPSTRLVDIRVAGQHELIETETSLTRPGGRVAATLRSVSVSRGTAENSKEHG